MPPRETGPRCAAAGAAPPLGGNGMLIGKGAFLSVQSFGAIVCFIKGLFFMNSTGLSSLAEP